MISKIKSLHFLLFVLNAFSASGPRGLFFKDQLWVPSWIRGLSVPLKKKLNLNNKTLRSSDRLNFLRKPMGVTKTKNKKKI